MHINQSNIPISLNYGNNMCVISFVALLLIVLTIWTLVGNALVLFALVKDSRLRTTSNILIGNLAISDFLLALTVLPLSTWNDLLGYWPCGLILCNIWLSMDVLNCTASVWGLVAIALDRFTATSFPLWYRNSMKTSRTLTIATLVWLFSIIICAPTLTGWNGKSLEHPMNKFLQNYRYSNGTGQHQCHLFSDPYYVVYSALGSFIIPLILMVALYLRIFLVMRRQSTYTHVINKSNIFSIINPVHNLSLHTPNNIEQFKVSTSKADSLSHSEFTQQEQDLNDEDEEELNPLNPPAPASHWNKPHYTNASHKPRKIISNTLEMKPRLKIDHNNSSTSTPLRPLLPKSPRKGRAIVNKQKSTLAALILRKTCTLTPSEKRERRATKRMALIIGLFVICWIPFTLMYLIRALCGDTICPDIVHLRMFFIWLGYANSGLNPILYTIFNKDFRNAFKKFLKFKC